MTSPTTNVETNLGQLSALGTSIWLDAIRRAWIESGELDRMIQEDSVVGMTSNPAIFQKAILGSEDYDERLAGLTKQGADTQTIYERLAIEDVRDVADILRPVYERTNGLDGFVSLEVAPALANRAEETFQQATDLWNRVNRPNVLIKIPGTRNGCEAIRRSIASGINVNVTLLFDVDQYAMIVDAFLAGLEDRVAQSKSIDDIASVASFFVSRVDTAVDKRLEAKGADADLLGLAGIANSKLAYAAHLDILESDRWKALAAKGARPQRVLWASTSTKDPRFPDTMYVSGLAGPNVVNTLPYATLLAYQEHGRARDELTGSAEAAKADLKRIKAAGVDMKRVTSDLLEAGIQQFIDAMDQLLAGVETRRKAVMAGKPGGIEAQLTDEQAKRVGARVAWARERDVARRMWAKDYTLWQPHPNEITEPDRLGWLTIAEKVTAHLHDLEVFADEVRKAGFDHVCLLGMGGSSLAPITLHDAFGDQDGYPRLHFLDSTQPDNVLAVQRELDVAKTLFIFATKSGGTLETVTFYRYFADKAKDGSQFVALTDPGTEAQTLAEREGFRHVFLNDAGIGGRFSALSYFGAVVATLAGMPFREILAAAEQAVHNTLPAVAYERSRGLWLGLAVGELARSGRNKLTFICDPPLESFGLWVEQLVAESTGKQGRGIVPIVGEPLGPPQCYGDDRVFVHLRNDEGSDEETESKLAELIDAGHAVLTVPFTGKEDIGRLFFMWEFAIATAGAVLEINSFNQPNVQQAKTIARQQIGEYCQRGRFPDREPCGALGTLTAFNGRGKTFSEALGWLLDLLKPGSYLATMAYMPYSQEMDDALERLRTEVRNGLGVATTVGYGPRFLHSTGQLHKGGPDQGVFLQLTCDGAEGVAVPGEQYDFAALVEAQARGDVGALRQVGRNVVTVHIAGDPVEGVERLAKEIARILMDAK